MQKEITRRGKLLSESGRLDEAGWSRTPLKLYERKLVKASHLRIKEWDYYLINDGKRALALTIADNSYMGMYSVSWMDLEKPKAETRSIMTVLPMGKTKLPESSEVGDVSFRNKKAELAFRNDGTERKLFCRWSGFEDGKTLEASVTLTDEPEDSIVMMTPYKEDRYAFYYNQKINCLKAQGYVRLGTDVYRFLDTYGVLDWGRGVWTYSNTWYWASASSEIDGIPFGFNLGYGFGDTSAASENALFYKGKIHKLDQIRFNIPEKNGKDDFMSPWTFTSDDGRFYADFIPVIDRASDTNVLLIESDQHQVFGRYTGKAVLDDGTVLEFRDMPGFAEKVKNRW